MTDGLNRPVTPLQQVGSERVARVRAGFGPNRGANDRAIRRTVRSEKSLLLPQNKGPVDLPCIPSCRQISCNG
jgi:hypothetical protein